MRKCFLLLLLSALMASAQAVERQRSCFNDAWLMKVGDIRDAAMPLFGDSDWTSVTLPHAWNEDEAYRVACAQLSDGVVWYRKHFLLSAVDDRRFFIEFEGVRFAADVYVNGDLVGTSENGVMAFGFDITPYVKQGENVIAVRTDNDWNYHERATGSTYQWNNKNFNANYGGIPKNVWLHTTGLLHQTLPLYSTLGTTGTYVYATDFDIARRKAVVHVESQVCNDDDHERSFRLIAHVLDADNQLKTTLSGDCITLQPGEMRSVSIQDEVSGLHFWSWGYGYLYTVKVFLADAHSLLESHTLDAQSDEVVVRTGFRKTHFADGQIWLNDRVIMMHGSSCL